MPLYTDVHQKVAGTPTCTQVGPQGYLRAEVRINGLSPLEGHGAGGTDWVGEDGGVEVFADEVPLDRLMVGIVGEVVVLPGVVF